ncbi:MAG: acyl carrier protein [Thermoanaerobaculia bacterium]
MSFDPETVREEIRRFLLDEFLPGEDPGELADTTSLITGGIVDSIATLKLVSFLEERYAISLEAHEVDADHLDSVDRLVALVAAKRQGQ